MIRNIALAALAAVSMSLVACAAPTDATDDATEVEESAEELVSRSARFETFTGLDSKYYFHMLAGNGENVLRSQGYTRLASAQNGVSSVLENGYDKRNFDVKQAKNGDWYFNLKAGNGQIIGTSEMYASKSNAERGARTVRALVRLTYTTVAAPRRESFELFKGEDSKTYFRLRGGNGEIMLASQGYTAKASAEKGIASVELNGADAANYEIFETADGGWAIRLKARNGEIVARGESYSTKSNATRAVNRLAEIFSARGDVSVTAL